MVSTLCTELLRRHQQRELAGLLTDGHDLQ